MKLRLVKLLLSVCAIATFPAQASEKKSAGELKFCTGLDEKIDFSPFHNPMESGRERYWVMLLTVPYIARSPHAPSILEAYSFSPDGRTMTARVSSRAKWLDGTPVSSKEAAYGIARGLNFRFIPGISVAGDWDASDWASRPQDSVKIMNDREFRIIFSSTVENASGFLREALSTGEFNRRMWPARLSKLKGDKYRDGGFDLVSKYPVVKLHDGSYAAKVHGYTVRLAQLKDCQNSDFTRSSWPKTFSSLDDYSVSLNNHESFSVFAVMSPSSSFFGNLDLRRETTGWLRSVIKRLPENLAMTSTTSHFQRGESGFSGLSWPSNAPVPVALKKAAVFRVHPFSNSYTSSPLWTKIASTAQSDGVKFEWVDQKTAYANFDIALFSYAVDDQGRQPWLQDINVADRVKEFLKVYPKTLSALNRITERSASTLVIGDEVLAAFERASFEEQSFVPLGRFRQAIMSAKKSPLTAVYSDDNELEILLRRSP